MVTIKSTPLVDNGGFGARILWFEHIRVSATQIIFEVEIRVQTHKLCN